MSKSGDPVVQRLSSAPESFRLSAFCRRNSLGISLMLGSGRRALLRFGLVMNEDLCRIAPMPGVIGGKDCKTALKPTKYKRLERSPVRTGVVGLNDLAVQGTVGRKSDSCDGHEVADPWPPSRPLSRKRRYRPSSDTPASRRLPCQVGQSRNQGGATRVSYDPGRRGGDAV